MTLLFLFWLSFAIILYTYLGYPLCLAVLRQFRPRPVAKSSIQPTVSVVMAVCNEEQAIRKRLENLLAQDYLGDKLEIVVVSDGSRDRTVEFALNFHMENIKVVELAERGGKAAALNAGIACASGEVVVFCDARQSFDGDTIRQLVGNFSDPKVGCVSGELMLHKSGADGIQVEMGAYWRYEKWIRRAESDSGSVIGATGAVYAIRRLLYRDLPQGTLLDDVMTPMHVVMQGYRTVFDASAKAHDVVSSEVSQEWVRKVRTMAGNWQLINLKPVLLLPWKNPCCWRYLSHKILRLLSPLSLFLLAITSVLQTGPLFGVATSLQLVLYSIAMLGGAVPSTRRSRFVSVIYFFVIMNATAIAGFWCWAKGGSATVWRPAYVKEE